MNRNVRAFEQLSHLKQGQQIGRFGSMWEIGHLTKKNTYKVDRVFGSLHDLACFLENQPKDVDVSDDM